MSGPRLRKGVPVTLCRYHPGNEYQLVTGTVVSASKTQTVLLVDRTEVIFPCPPWNEVIL